MGVVDDVKSYSFKGPPEWVDGEIYLPLSQATATPRNLALVARLGNDPAAFEQLESAPGPHPAFIPLTVSSTDSRALADAAPAELTHS